VIEQYAEGSLDLEEFIQKLNEKPESSIWNSKTPANRRRIAVKIPRERAENRQTKGVRKLRTP
jgi:hypothetical protein